MKLIALTLTFLIFLGTKLPIFAAVSFEISNSTLEGDYYIVDTKISGISSESAYVQGMLKHPDSSSYFGFTWGQKGEWFGYDGSVTKEYIQENFPILQRDIVQKIWIRPDFAHSAYKGPGSYLLKLKRYTGNSDSDAGSSNELTIQLTEPTPTPTSEPTTTTTPTTSTTPTIIITPTKTPTPTVAPQKVTTPTPTKDPIPASPTVVKQLSTITSSPSATIYSSKPEIDPESETTPQVLSSTTSAELTPKKPLISHRNWFLIGIIIFSLSGGVLYFRLNSH